MVLDPARIVWPIRYKITPSTFKAAKEVAWHHRLGLDVDQALLPLR